MVHPSNNGHTKTIFDNIQEVTDINEMQHAISREALKYFNITKPLIITSISDVYSTGSGLGSSSSYTVGLINCLENSRFHYTTKQFLANAACEIEIEKCGYPIGKQDQYAAAFGGFNNFYFFNDESVEQTPINFDFTRLEERLVLIYSGVGRNANDILSKQSAAMEDSDKFNLVIRNRDRAIDALDYLIIRDFDSFGYLLNDAWEDKKKVVKGISDPYFDSIYYDALKLGSLGGKLLGAGGGGFFLFYCPSQYIKENLITQITREYPKTKNYPFKFTNKGSEIIYHD